jgi:hypothetical protein
MTVAQLTYAAHVVLSAVDPTPQDKDVKAGWTAFALFLLLGVAVALLGWSLVRQLRKAQAAEDAGVYGHDEEPAESEPAAKS